MPAGPRTRCASSAPLGNSEQAQEWGRLANEHPPVLRTHDRYGNRIDEVEYLPQYHELMRTAVEHGLHGAPWADDRPGAHVARAAKVMAWGVADAGHLCPISMTYAVVPALRDDARRSPPQYEPLLTNRSYDFGLRAPLTQARADRRHVDDREAGRLGRPGQHDHAPSPNADGSYRLTGHKWFTSAPMSDLFLTLAQTPRRAVLLPRPARAARRHPQRVLPAAAQGQARQQVQRLVARSSTTDALGWLVGDEGRGVRTIIEMVNMTRLDCSLMAAGGMRIGAAHAIHHATHRHAFGKALHRPAGDGQRAGRPGRRLRGRDHRRACGMAGAVDRADSRRRRRGGVPPGRARRSRSTGSASGWSTHTAEALECLGGNGYIEESGHAAAVPRGAARLDLGGLRQRRRARHAARDGQGAGGGRGVLRRTRAGRRQPTPRYDDALALLRKEFSDADELEYRARHVVERMALLLQGSLLLRHGDPAVAEAFVALAAGPRLGRRLRHAAAGLDTAAILERAARAHDRLAGRAHRRTAVRRHRPNRPTRRPPTAR